MQSIRFTVSSLSSRFHLFSTIDSDGIEPDVSSVDLSPMLGLSFDRRFRSHKLPKESLRMRGTGISVKRELNVIVSLVI